MRTRICLTAAIIALTTTSALAFDFRTTTRMKITILSDTEFRVSGTPRFGAQSYWCAASQFALARLGLRFSDRLYIAQPRSGDGPVVFSTKPGAVTPTRSRSIVTTTSTPGGALSVGRSNNFCGDESPSAIN